jgi:VanZ family protein
MKPHRFWIIGFWLYLGILMTIIISAYLKILPVKSSTIPFYDTVGHFILIGIAAFLCHLALKKRRISYLNLSLPLASILVIILTVIEECLQTLSPYRTFDLIDLASDFCGIVLFTWLAEKFIRS